MTQGIHKGLVQLGLKFKRSKVRSERNWVGNVNCGFSVTVVYRIYVDLGQDLCIYLPEYKSSGSKSSSKVFCN